MTSRSTWQEGERRIARLFGTARTPLSGINSGHTRSDTLHDELFIEVKHNKKPPGDNLWRLTSEFAEIEGKTPAIVFIKKAHRKPLILLRIEDLKKVAELIEDDSSG